MRTHLNRKLTLGLKCILILMIVSFIWFNLKINNYETESIGDPKSPQKQSVPIVKTTSDELLVSFKSTQISINDLKSKIESINAMEKVLNFDSFGPLLDNHLVIIIQVHKRVQYLKALIDSLEQTNGINDVLLVFSHDIFDSEINSVIGSIKFCKVIQIFYPNSLQLNPNSFPGESANDCPRDISKTEAVRMDCINALSPDTYGHYREAKYTQTKHHWWWKISTVFDGLNHTRHHSGQFMFLEEDHYLSPDALHVLRLINEFRNRNGIESNVITLGSYSRSISFGTSGDKIELSDWVSSQHNMGFVIERNVWNDIKNCAKVFCTYDDYNWDWSLHYLSRHCLSTPLLTFVVSTPRVYHTGECGLHHSAKRCDSNQVIKKIDNIFKSSQKYLFPKQLNLQKVFKKPFRMPKVNGGWADPRDHRLCLNQII